VNSGIVVELNHGKGFPLLSSDTQKKKKNHITLKINLSAHFVASVTEWGSQLYIWNTFRSSPPRGRIPLRGGGDKRLGNYQKTTQPAKFLSGSHIALENMGNGGAY
jgi:hypothetical protein